MERIGVFCLLVRLQHCRHRGCGPSGADPWKKNRGLSTPQSILICVPEAGQNLVMEAIREHRLTGVVICSAPPGCMKPHFARQSAGPA